MLALTVIAEPSQDTPEYSLIVSEKGGQERRIVCRADELSIGRVAGNDLVLPKGNISKRHARILYREGRFIVTDLNSTNGTYVNRQRIEQATIVREEDNIFIGDFMIRLELSPERTEAGEPTTPRRSSERRIPTLSPEAESSFTAQQNAGAPTAQHTRSAPSWERISNLDEGMGRSSGPPAQSMESLPPDAYLESPRRTDPALASYRSAVAQILEQVEAEWGEIPLVPDEEYRTRVLGKLSQLVDQLLVDGQIPVGTSPEAVIEQAEAELFGLGPLDALLEDSSLSTISIGQYEEIVGVREGRAQICPPGFSRVASLKLALARLCERSGLVLEERQLLTRAKLASGERLSIFQSAAVPQGMVVVIEKPRQISSSLDDLVRRGVISRSMATYLSYCVQARLNVLVVGSREEGGPVVLGALAQATRERLILASDFDEFVQENEVLARFDLSQLQADTHQLFEFVSALPQARPVVTFSSPAHLASALSAWGGCLSGVLASLPAVNLQRALLRLPVEIAGRHAGMSLEVAAGWLQSSFDLVLEVSRLRDGRVRVLRIAELVANERGLLEARDIFRFTVSRVAAGGAVEGTFAPTGQSPQNLSQLQPHGLRLDSALFSRPPSR